MRHDRRMRLLVLAARRMIEDPGYDLFADAEVAPAFEPAGFTLLTEMPIGWDHPLRTWVRLDDR